MASIVLILGVNTCLVQGMLEEGEIGVKSVGGDEVNLVDDEEELLIAQIGLDATIDVEGVLDAALGGGGISKTGAIDEPKHNLSTLETLIGSLDAHGLDLVAGVANACGVDEANELPVEEDGVLDDVARGAVNIAHDGTFVAQQVVEKGGLADIGLADDCHRDAITDGLTRAEGVGQTHNLGIDLTGNVEQFRAIGKLNILLAEIEFEFEQRRKTEQLVVQSVELAADAALHLTEGKTMGGGILCRNEVGHGFGLTEVHTPIGKGTSRELATLCHAYTAEGGEDMEQFLLDICRTMAGDLDHVFARETMGRTIECHDDFVEHFLGVGMNDPAKGEGVGCALVESMSSLERLEDLGTCRNRIRATDANDGYSANARWGGKGANSHISSNSMISPSEGS